MLSASIVFILVVCGRLAIAADNRPLANRQGRVVGGETAEPSQFPFMVSMRTFENEHFCGGSIIASYWVLTVAHCTNGRTAATTLAVVGAHHIESDGIPHIAARLILHEDFDDYYLVNDISLVQTQSEIIFTDAVSPININAATIGAGIRARFSGWGKIEVCILYKIIVSRFC